MTLAPLLSPHELSDEPAAQLCEFLNDLAFSFECQHLDQTRRYYEELRDSERSCHNGPLDLFAGDDAEFSIPPAPARTPPTAPVRRRRARCPIFTTTTTTSVTTAAPAHIRVRLSDNDGAM